MRFSKQTACAISVALVVGACGGGGAGPNASPQTGGAATPPNAVAEFRQVSVFNFESHGTALAIASVPLSPSAGLIVFNGPTWDNSAGRFDCLPVGYRALHVDGSGSITDGAAFLTSTTAATHAGEAAVGDFNGDGQADIFFGNSGCDNPPHPGERNTVFMNEGGELVERADRMPDLRVMTHGAAAADLRGVGRDDALAVVIGPGHDQLAPIEYLNRGNTPFGNAPYFGAYIMRGNADGSFGYDTESLPDRFAKGHGHLWTVARFGDIDGDGRPDLIIGDGGNGAVAGYAYLNDGQGAFRTAEIALPVGAFGTGNTVVSDIRFFALGQQRYVLVLSTSLQPFYAKERATVLRFNGAGFDDVTNAVLPAFGERSGWSQHAWFVDLTGDGCPEMVISKDFPQGEDVMVFECRGGRLEPMASQPAQRHSLTPVRVGARTFLVSLRAVLHEGPQRSVVAYEYR